MKNVIELLKEFNEISDYRVITNEKTSYELFFVHEKLETVRSTDTSETNVTVYVDHSKYRGLSSFTLSHADNEDTLRDKIRNAIKMASLINNKKYTLPANEVLNSEIESNFKDYEPKELGAKMYKVLMNCASQSKAKLNATEIFLYKTKVNIKNSQNLDKTSISYKAMIETIPTYDTKKDSVEIYTQLNFSTFDEVSLSRKIKQALKDVTARARAKKPDYEIDCNVLLRPQEISQIVFNYASDLNYSTIYNKMNKYNKGDDIQKDSNGDKITLTMLGQIKGSSQSRIFDEDGVTLSKKRIFKDGIAVANFGSNTYAKYLHKKVTGNLSLVELKKGTKKEKELKEMPYLECASFSGLQVNLDADYIGGEVRLAYYFDGKKTYPVTGISISGKLSEVLKTIQLSNKVVTEDCYKGPNYALLKGIKIF